MMVYLAPILRFIGFVLCIPFCKVRLQCTQIRSFVVWKINFIVMAYAVVQFLEECDDDDQAFSEVPSSWLHGDNFCWWPLSKSVGNLINKMVPPNELNGKWKLYPVQVHRKIDNYEMARKLADDYDSSSEKGRGKRKKKTIPQESDSSENESISIVHKAILDIPEYPNILPTTLSSGSSSASWSGLQVLHEQEQSSQQNNIGIGHDNSSDEFEPEETLVNEANVDLSVVNVSTDQLVEELAKTINEQFKIIHRMLAKIQVSLDRIATNSNANVCNMPESSKQYMDEIKSTFPVSQVDAMKDMDKRINEDKEMYTLLVKYLKTVGGSTLKDKIVRLLKKLFSNEVVAKTSWLGHSRGQSINFKLSSLKLIGAVKEAVQDDLE